MSLRILTVVFQLSLKLATAQDCLQPAGRDQVAFQSSHDGEGFGYLPDNSQALVTSYHFHCCGNITLWQTYVQPVTFALYDIRFQVWRPSLRNGCYSLVGENSVDLVSDGELSSGLVSSTPEPSNVISVRPGDVVGYQTFSLGREFAVSTLTSGGGGILLLRERDYESESVWYGPREATGEVAWGAARSCVAPERDLGSFTNAAPVLSVDISTFSCPSSSLTTLPHPTPAPPTPPPASSEDCDSHPTATTRTSTTTTTQSSQPNHSSQPDQPQPSQSSQPSQPSQSSQPSQPSQSSAPCVEITGALAGVCVLAVILAILVVLVSAIAIHRGRTGKRGSQQDEEMVDNPAYAHTSSIHTTTNESYAANVVMSANQAYDKMETSPHPLSRASAGIEHFSQQEYDYISP